jgi:hypothetical protein
MWPTPWQADALDRWRGDAESLVVEEVFASQIADLA